MECSLQSARRYSGSCDSQASTSQEFWKWNLLRDCDKHLLLGTAFFLVSPPLNCAAYEHILPTSGFTKHDLCMPSSLCIVKDSESILQCVPEKKTAKKDGILGCCGHQWSIPLQEQRDYHRLNMFEISVRNLYSEETWQISELHSLGCQLASLQLSSLLEKLLNLKHRTKAEMQ